LVGQKSLELEGQFNLSCKFVRNSRKEKLRHSQHPKNGGGGGDATMQQRNGEIETSKKRRKKIRSDNGESRDRDPPDSRPNAHPTSKFNSTEQQHISYSFFMSAAALGQIGRKQERVIKT
jgi:hypothetical protein